ncbi:MAG: hypothetical protein JW958_11410 [Candidatus Eisenbacteria bacterium]|nr:hypothetical protein [Candidatus Eisenbacteria bacterium]
MADKEAKEKEKAKAPEKKKGGFGVKKFLLLFGGAVLIFVGSMPVFLYLNGMLTFQAPYLVPAEGFAAVDSILAAVRTIEEAGAAPAAADATPAIETMGPPEELAESGDERAESPEENGDAELTEESKNVGAASEAAEETPAMVETTGPPWPPEGKHPAGEGGEDEEEPYRFPLDGENLARLVKVYDAMRPKQVALILNTMPERQASAILANMKEKSAASVLAELEPKKAARMSELIVRVGVNER